MEFCQQHCVIKKWYWLSVRQCGNDIFDIVLGLGQATNLKPKPRTHIKTHMTKSTRFTCYGLTQTYLRTTVQVCILCYYLQKKTSITCMKKWCDQNSTEWSDLIHSLSLSNTKRKTSITCMKKMMWRILKEGMIWSDLIHSLSLKSKPIGPTCMDDHLQLWACAPLKCSVSLKATYLPSAPPVLPANSLVPSS
jgi:hypothetical protein